MRVEQLQQFIRALVPPLREAGASATVVRQLEEAADALAPFHEQPLATFTSFLQRAEEYDRTGILPIAAKPAPRKPAKPKTPAITPETALDLIHSIQQRAPGDDFSYADIDQALKPLDKLKAPELVAVANQFGLTSPKNKKQALEAITKKLKDYKQGHLRIQF